MSDSSGFYGARTSTQTVDDTARRTGVALEIIIPALNEAQRIRPTLQEVCAYLRLLPYRCMVTVVDNGSADTTADIVKAFATEQVPVQLIGCRHKGKGAAVKAGVMASNARWVGFLDADLATPIAALAEVLIHLDAGSPMVIGSRRIGGASYAVSQPLARRIGSWGFRRLTRSIAGSVTDTQCGFKFFDRVVGQQLFSDVTSAGFSFDLELVAAASRLKIKVTEVPVTWTDQEGSSLRPLEHGFDILHEILALRKLRNASADRQEKLGVAA